MHDGQIILLWIAVSNAITAIMGFATLLIARRTEKNTNSMVAVIRKDAKTIGNAEGEARGLAAGRAEERPPRQ